MTRLKAMLARSALATLLITAPVLAPSLLAQGQPTAAQIEAGRVIVAGSGIVRSFDAILPQYAEQVRQALVTRPELSKDLNEVLERLKPELEQQKNEMIEIAARIFASRLSDQELKDIGAFFTSASGKRYVETQPAVLDEMFQEMQNWTGRVSNFIFERVRTELKKKGHDL